MFTVTKKEINMRRFALLFSISFMVLAYKCSAQTPMKFSCGDSKIDTIYISAKTDSLGNNYLVSTCSKHKHKDWTSITLGFVDGTMLELRTKDNYRIKDVSKISTTKFDYISFDEIFASTACVSIKNKEWFIKFFNPNN